MRPWIIIPFSRPEMLDNVIANVGRQIQQVEVCVAENGDALGTCERSGWSPSLVVRTENHQSLAKNEAIRRVKALGATHFITFDDDDYYGPEYVSEVVDAFQAGHRFVGKLEHFVRLDSMRKIVLINQGKCESECECVAGPTISAEISGGTPRFCLTDWGEDLTFCSDVANLGQRFYATSRRNFCYQRRHNGSGHAYPSTDSQFLHCARVFGEVLDLGNQFPDVCDRLFISGHSLSQVEISMEMHPLGHLVR